MQLGSNRFNGATILITGGTGSFGTAFLKRCLEMNVQEVRIFSRDEKKQYDLMQRYEDKRIRCIIGDVRDEQSVKDAMFGADYVFHAAAMKQVPSSEEYPLEAVKTNVIGSSNVLRAAADNGVYKIVMLSTDKACYPTSAMGHTKALMEKEAMRFARNDTGYTNPSVVITRFGNLFASRGSVVPSFLEQIYMKERITITDPNMTRFVMTLNDAIDLVMYAFDTGKNGDLFVYKSKAATVEDIGKAVMMYSKKKVDVKYIGARPGEKMNETLLTEEEALHSEESDKFYRVNSSIESPEAVQFSSEFAEMYTPLDMVDMIRREFGGDE